MILTLILLSIGALLFLVIAYNVVQQYKQKAESDKRQAIARHKAVADETEEVLLNVNLVPFSKNMVLLLQHRILDAYRAIALVMPNAQVKQRIADVQLQIKKMCIRDSTSCLRANPESSHINTFIVLADLCNEDCAKCGSCLLYTSRCV